MGLNISSYMSEVQPTFSYIAECAEVPFTSLAKCDCSSDVGGGRMG